MTLSGLRSRTKEWLALVPLSAWEGRKAWAGKIQEFSRGNRAEYGSRVVEFESRLR